MSDNIAITAGSGTTVATDDVAGVHYQRVKLMDGTADSSAVIPGDATNGLDVDVTRLPALVAGTANIGDVDVASIAAGTNYIGKVRLTDGTNDSSVSTTGAVYVGGSIAHDAGDSGNPLKVGAKAIAGLNGATLVSAADLTDLYAGLDGAQIVRPHCCLEDIVSGTASNTDGARFSVIAAGAAGIKHYLTQVTVANTSTAMITCNIDDGTSTKYVLPVPAQSGVTVTFQVPLPGSAATAWQCDPSAATTTVYCSMVAFKSKV